MPETTLPYDGEVSMVMCVTRDDGTKVFYRQSHGVNVEITEAEYAAEAGAE